MPGMICSVAICTSNSYKAKKSGEKIQFFNFPSDKLIRKQWVQRCYRKDKFDPKNKRICGKHFLPDDYEDALQARLLHQQPKKLKKNAVPSINLLPETHIKNPAVVVSTSSSTRMKRASQKITKETVEKILDSAQSTTDIENVSQNLLEDIPSTSYEDPISDLKLKYLAVLNENEILQKKRNEDQTHFIALNNKIIELQQLLNDKERNVKMLEYLSEVFTPNQLDILLKKKSRSRWTLDEISKAFTLRYFSKRAYIYVREKLKFPLPGISTLQRWAAHIKLRDGLLKDVISVMGVFGKNTNNRGRVTIISFDEMKVSSTYEYDKIEDEVIGEHKYMQVVMARGLFEKWKQPIYVGFDKKMTKTILFEIISELHKINYYVVGCVSDCGGGNMGLWKELEIQIDKTYCHHPITMEKIYFFADVPHLIKLTRNWLLDTGFCLDNGTVITSEPVKLLIESVNTEVSSCYKLTSLHVTCERTQRQNVGLAAQLLSDTTATALRRYLPGPDKEEARNLADFIELMHRWFQLLNTYSPVAKLPTNKPYGQDLESQNELLVMVEKTFKTMRCRTKNTLQIFQKGVIITTNSIKNLYEDLKKKYEISYILTHRLNQDCLENLFSQVRMKGGLHDHPSPLNALYRLRMILIGKNAGIVQRHTNVEVEDFDDYVLCSAFKKAHINNKDMESPPPMTVIEEDSTSTDSLSSTSILSSNKRLSETDGLEYIAGFVAKKFLKKHPHLGSYSKDSVPLDLHTYSMPSWVQSLSFGGLIKPSKVWLNTVITMEKYFQKFHQDTFKAGTHIISNTTNYISRKLLDVPRELVKEYSKLRIFIRIKYLNTKRTEKINLGKRKAETDAQRKTIKKIKKVLK